MSEAIGAKSERHVDTVQLLLWAVALCGVAVTVPVQASLGATYYGVPVVIALLLAVVQGAAIVVSLLQPLVAVILSAAGLLGFTLLSLPLQPWPVAVMSMIAHCLVILLVSIRTGWWLGLVGVVVAAGGAFAVALDMARSDSGAVTADLIVFTALSGICLLLGALINQWAGVREQLVQERAISAAEQARREAVEERTRLARELHDVVAHGMSAIQVQASSARYRIPSLPDDAAAEFDDIAALARTSMAEMRTLLAVLRNEGSTAESVPQPGVADIPQLVGLAARAGARVSLDDGISPEDAAAFDPVISLTVYRVVQESLSNVARHATGADTLVTLRSTDGVVNVEVRNAAPDLAQDAAGGASEIGGGHGIRGMRERVGLHGGTLETDHTNDGGFVVRARIPLLTGKDAT
ncbi:sensor histidine kinase [Humibacter sp. RRB41]|uniref:sensor histidine kinase n=1 Tax=Humibacter sp. RRB41 TaxID=2919946 RepID=UPI001FAA75A8|nr:sensor histidine kinase [Humibacter sp. RRB41]